MRRRAVIHAYVECDPITVWKSFTTLPEGQQPQGEAMSREEATALPEDQYAVAEILQMDEGKCCAYRIRGAMYDRSWRADFQGDQQETKITVTEELEFHKRWFWLFSYIVYHQKELLRKSVDAMIQPLRKSKGSSASATSKEMRKQ